jgi:hypothetical protein
VKILTILTVFENFEAIILSSVNDRVRLKIRKIYGRIAIIDAIQLVFKAVLLCQWESILTEILV